ncbi:MAG: hypothetical protein JO138_25795 [Acidobacteriaceae bacterium]|nr:hypothetical protein [Acidobacteriaceae bacterium]
MSEALDEVRNRSVNGGPLQRLSALRVLGWVTDVYPLILIAKPGDVCEQ